MAPPSAPIELPLAGPRPERGDAAANRRLILAAARRLLSERGSGEVSMDAVASAAGVGKGTVFRRFTDRSGLIAALVSDYMRDFQDAFLSGPPPLGPGAPPAQRLEAFLVGLVDLQHEHLPLALAAEHPAPRPAAGAYTALFLHTRALVASLSAGADADVLATMLLGAVSPPVLHQVIGFGLGDRTAIKAGINVLIRGLAS